MVSATSIARGGGMIQAWVHTTLADNLLANAITAGQAVNTYVPCTPSYVAQD